MNSLDDIIDYNLKLLFIGYNPGLKSAVEGHHYASNSNNFWKLLYEAGLTPYKFRASEDRKLLELGIGSTNIVGRPTRGASEIKTAEYKQGAIVLKKLITAYKPRIVGYTGIGIYKRFSGREDAGYGLQDTSIVDGVLDYVCPSPSGLNRMPYREQLEHFKGLNSLLKTIR